MPMYDYKCQSCNLLKEMYFKFPTPLKVFCQCGKEMQRQISKPAVHFKGSGFYETDYKNK